MRTIKKIICAILISLMTVLMVPTVIPINETGYIVEAASVKISKTKYTMNKGENYTLKIKGTKKKVKWSSNNKKVATVNSKGKVTAKNKGTATITAKVGSKKYKCKITVESPSINKTKVNINQGKTYTLKVKGTSRKVTWSSSNKKIATVNSKGKVSAKKKGTATITAKVGSKKLKCKVTVKYVKKVKAVYMYIDYDETNVKVGETIKLTAKVTPTNYTSEIKWKSSNEKIATVKNGVVKGVSSGKTKITATIDGLSYSVDVYVLGEITLTLKNALPEKYGYKPSSRIVTMVEISDIKFDYTPNFYSQEYTIKMTLSGTKTYQYYSNIDSIAVAYKIIDESGNVYDTGNFWKSGLSVGDRFNNVSTPLDLPPGNYTLVLTNY